MGPVEEGDPITDALVTISNSGAPGTNLIGTCDVSGNSYRCNRLNDLTISDKDQIMNNMDRVIFGSVLLIGLGLGRFQPLDAVLVRV